MRPIDADAFNAKLQDDYHGAVSDSYLYIYQIWRLIDAAPTVQAASVVHGKWILSSTAMQCSECKKVYEIDMYSPICAETAHYCNNCGAKMDL